MFVLFKSKDIISIGIEYNSFHIQIWNCISSQSFIKTYSCDFFKKMIQEQNIKVNDMEQTIDDIIFENIDHSLLNIFYKFLIQIIMLLILII